MGQQNNMGGGLPQLPAGPPTAQSAFPAFQSESGGQQQFAPQTGGYDPMASLPAKPVQSPSEQPMANMYTTNAGPVQGNPSGVSRVK